MHIKADYGDKPSESVRAVAGSAPLVVITSNVYRDLRKELGSEELVIKCLLEIATNTGKPIGLNLSDGKGGSYTSFISPKGWTEGKLKGWVAAHHRQLGKAFGDIDWIGKPPKKV